MPAACKPIHMLANALKHCFCPSPIHMSACAHPHTPFIANVPHSTPRSASVFPPTQAVCKDWRDTAVIPDIVRDAFVHHWNLSSVADFPPQWALAAVRAWASLLSSSGMHTLALLPLVSRRVGPKAAQNLVTSF
eukprot:405583-Pelagomonas_calceolata.AAC.1